jgi:sulfatase maturation enzyme AslB (radical SAM superfamily)
VSAETVLKKLKEVLPEVSRHKVEVKINCVLTTANLGHMHEFLQMVKDVSPSIGVSFTPLIPPDDPLSVLSDESYYRQFMSSFDDLKRRGFNVAHAFDGIMRHKDYKNIQCLNQYFIIRVTPEGHVVTCAMNIKMGAEHYKYYLGKLFTKGGISKALNRIKKKTAQRLQSSPDFSCNTMCACENWLDLIFLGLKSDYLAGYVRGLRGRMTQADYDEAEAFIKKYVNPAFSGQTLRNIIETAKDVELRPGSGTA